MIDVVNLMCVRGDLGSSHADESTVA